MTTYNSVCERAVATRNITKDEELCISYSMLTDTIAQIRNELRQKYRLDCMCEVCTTKNDIERNAVETNGMWYPKLDETLIVQEWITIKKAYYKSKKYLRQCNW